MEVAVDHVIRTNRSVGRGQIRNLPAVDLDLLLRNTAGLDSLLPLLAEAGRQGEVVAGLEKDAIGGPFAEKHVRADDGHVGDDRVAQHSRKHRLLQHKLFLDAAVHATIEAAQRDQVLAVATPLGQRVLQPEEVGKAAEPRVKALGRHAIGQRLGRHVGRRRGQFQRRRTQRLGQRLDRPAGPGCSVPEPGLATSPSVAIRCPSSDLTPSAIRHWPTSVCLSSGKRRFSRRASIDIK